MHVTFFSKQKAVCPQLKKIVFIHKSSYLAKIYGVWTKRHQRGHIHNAFLLSFQYEVLKICPVIIVFTTFITLSLFITFHFLLKCIVRCMQKSFEKKKDGKRRNEKRQTDGHWHSQTCRLTVGAIMTERKCQNKLR